MSSEFRVQDTLSAVTDAIITGHGDVDQILRHYDVPHHEIDPLLPIISGLNRRLDVVEPSPQFKANLKAELMGAKQTSLAWRIRKLPARVQVAALTALGWGFVLVLWQRFAGNGQSQSSDTAHEKA